VPTRDEALCLPGRGYRIRQRAVNVVNDEVVVAGRNRKAWPVPEFYALLTAHPGTTLGK